MDFELLKQNVGDLDEEAVLEVLNKIDNTEDAQKAMEACQKGMEIVGEFFETGEYFVGDLIFAGELMQDAVQVLKPFLAGESNKSVGKMVFCTVEGDLHDIGKNIVRSLLEAAGMEVIDLGVDVPPAKVVEAVKANGVKIVALSGVLTLAINAMKATVEALKAAGLSDVKVIIGGAPVTQEANEIVCADAWTKNPQETVKICTEWAKAV